MTRANWSEAESALAASAPCDGVVIVHAGSSLTCTNPDCSATRQDGLFDGHCYFVPCGETLGSACPVCRTLPEGAS